MHPDDREARSGKESSAPPEWSVEDFDDFAPFEAEGSPDEPEPEALDFGSLDVDGPVTRDPTRADAAGPATRDDERDSGAAVFDVEQVDLGTSGPVSGDAVDEPPREGTDADEAMPAPTEHAPESEPRDVEAVSMDEEPGEPEPEPATPAAHDAPRGDPFGDAEVVDDTDEDTIETGFEGGEAAGAAQTEDEDAVEVPDFASFTGEQYAQTTTQEFVDLAAEMEKAGETEHEQSAITAEIPGLESGVVGLDDVVAASGTDPSDILVAQRSNLALRVFTGLGLAFIFLASLYDPLFIGLFVFFVLTLSAGEFYSALMRAGYRPVALFGLLGTIGAMAGTWVWGPIAVPVGVAGTLAATLLFFGVSAERKDPMTNVALTVLGTAWVGGMGAFVFEMVEDDDYGWLIVATVLTVASMDIASYFIGRRMGRHRLAPRVSPKKTVEGLIGGMLIALLVGLAFGLREPFDLGSGLLLGAIVAAVAPLGDLAVSLMKRSIGVKDMGTLLPGHGGLLDRIDAMLFVIPLAWIAFLWTGLLV